MGEHRSGSQNGSKVVGNRGLVLDEAIDAGHDSQGWVEYFWEMTGVINRSGPARSLWRVLPNWRRAAHPKKEYKGMTNQDEPATPPAAPSTEPATAPPPATTPLEEPISPPATRP